MGFLIIFNKYKQICDIKILGFVILSRYQALNKKNTKHALIYI